MSNCSNHPKSVAGESDMKALAEQIGDLNYETLTELLYYLSKKIDDDSEKDYKDGKEKNAAALQELGLSLFESSLRAENVWQICKPFMNNNK